MKKVISTGVSYHIKYNKYKNASTKRNNQCSEYVDLPLMIQPSAKRIIVLGDIHGDYKLMLDMLKLANVIDRNKKWIGKDTIVVQVGDQIDNCRPAINKKCNEIIDEQDEDSDIKILEYMYKLHLQALKQGGQVISLLGNHELMNSMGITEYVSKQNMYGETMKKYAQENNVDISMARKHAFMPNNKYGKFLGCTRLSCVIIGKNLFVHGGLIDKFMAMMKLKNTKDLEYVDDIVRGWLLGVIETEQAQELLTHPDSLFWTRILGNLKNNDKNCDKYIENVLQYMKIGKIIIGHTPQSFMHNHGINSVCDNKIWRVDNGSSKAFDKYDTHYVNFGTINEYRKPQVLEIINDNVFRVIM